MWRQRNELLCYTHLAPRIYICFAYKQPILLLIYLPAESYLHIHFDQFHVKNLIKWYTSRVVCVIRPHLQQWKHYHTRGVSSLEGSNLVVFYYLITSDLIRGVTFGRSGLMRGYICYIHCEFQYFQILFTYQYSPVWIPKVRGSRCVYTHSNIYWYYMYFISQELSNYC